MTAGRLVAVFASALIVVAGLGYLASQTVWARQPLLLSKQSTYVDAPTPDRASRGGVSRERRSTPVLVDAQWVADTSAKAGIPGPAVRAYAQAQLARPAGCEVGWTTLAGIGWVESQHGTIDGRTLGDDGHSSSPILARR